ncbi:hypothetical protein BO94DRAFT_477772, partial [Aspergillus sclerotioniger CBS 115572]
IRILLLGATGFLGSRPLPSLLQHSHTVIPYIRTPSSLPVPLLPHLPTIIQSDPRSATTIKSAFFDHNCDAIINAAGYAAMFPWSSTSLPDIVDAVIQAAVEIGRERGRPVRSGFEVGVSANCMYLLWVMNSMHIFPSHQQTIAKLNALPKSSLNWSLLCPGVMYPASEEVMYPAWWGWGRECG